VDTETFKEKLLKLQTQLLAQIQQYASLGREQTADLPRDLGETSVADENASDDFTEAELTSTVLQQVREALRRIDNHTFGKCLVDGRPISRKRLEALPWTPYCLKHQTLLEAAARKQVQPPLM
jgi:DnaK suppressor protein